MSHAYLPPSLFSVFRFPFPPFTFSFLSFHLFCPGQSGSGQIAAKHMAMVPSQNPADNANTMLTKGGRWKDMEINKNFTDREAGGKRNPRWCKSIRSLFFMVSFFPPFFLAFLFSLLISPSLSPTLPPLSASRRLSLLFSPSHSV